jgi:hypothetical protein
MDYQPNCSWQSARVGRVLDSLVVALRRLLRQSALRLRIFRQFEPSALGSKSEMSASVGTTSIVSTRATISRYDAESTKRSAHGIGQDVEGLAHITMSTTAHDAARMLIGWCELRKDFRRFHASLSRGRDHRHRLSARAAGLLSLAGGGVSAQTVGLNHAVNMLASDPSHKITSLSEEEVSDVSSK